MKVDGVKTHIYFKGLLSSFCLIENGLTKKINPNTNIFNSAINTVQTFIDLFTLRHNVALNIACKTIIILLGAVQLQFA
jgi:hypothetical protein